MAPPKAATPLATQASKNKKAESGIEIINYSDYDIEKHLEVRSIVKAERHEYPQNYDAIMKMIGKHCFVGSQEELEAKAKIYQIRMERSINESLVQDAIQNILDTDRLYTHNFLWFGKEVKWNTRVKPFTEIQNQDLRPPTPDFSLGIHMHEFPDLALLCLGGYARPSTAKQVMPFLAIEAKSVKKNTEQAIFQNLYNGAIMVNNILHLKTKLGSDSEIYGVAKVFSFSFDQYNMRISVHWVQRIDGKLKFFGRRIKAWNIECDTPAYIAARQALFNVIDELEQTLGPEIVKDIKKLEANLIAAGITDENVQPDDGKPVGWEGTETQTGDKPRESSDSSDELSRG